MSDTKKPKKPKQKKTKETKSKASQHQSNKQRVTVNVHVGSKGGGRKSKGGSRQPQQPQPQQQVRPAPTVVNVAQPLPPMSQAPYVTIPTERLSERPAERITMIPGATVAGDMQNSVDRSLSATHSVSSIPTLMGSFVPAGHLIKMPEYEDDAVSEMSYDTPISQHNNPPMDMSEFLAMALPYKEQPISQPVSAMKAYAKEPAPYMMPIPMSEEELDFKRYYNNMNRSVASSVAPSEGPAPLVAPYIKSEKGPAPSVSSGKGPPAPSIASPDRAAARHLDAGTVISTPSHIEFKERMTNDSGINTERLKRMSKTELADQYIKYYKVQPHKGKTKAVLLDDVLKRFRK